MVDVALGIVGSLLYPLFSIIFVCIDGLQGLFYGLAGIGDMRFGGVFKAENITAGNSGGETDTGLIYYLLQNSLVKNLLMSIMLLALFLIIIFTVMAFIKNVYAAKQKGWKEIIGNSIKGLANFILLPVLCLLGVWLANILLQAINGATSHGGGTQMSRKLFISCAYNANVFRYGWADEDDWEGLKEFAEKQKYSGASNIKAGLTTEQYADFVDDIYETTNVHIWNQVSVGRWYVVWSVNYLVLVVGGVFMLYALGALAFAMVKRFFILIILFVVSPGVCALYPLDEGKAVQSWAGEVKKNVLSAHGSVAALNIFFALLPLIEQINFGGLLSTVFSTFAGIDNLIQLFILVVGLLSVKEFTGLLSGFIGGGDAYGQGSGQIKNLAGTIGKTAVGAAVVGGFVKDHGGKLAKSAWGTAKTGASTLNARFQAGRDVKRKHKQDALAEKESKLREKLEPMSEKHAAEMTPEGRAEWKKEHQHAVDYFAKKDRKAKKQADKAENKRIKEGHRNFKKAAGKDGYSYNEETGEFELNDVGMTRMTEKLNEQERKEGVRKAKAKSAAEKRDNKERSKQAKRDEMNAALEAHGYSGKMAEFKKEGKGLGSELKKTATAIYEDSGAKDKVEKITKNFKKSKDAQEVRDKKDKDGPGGINKSIDKLAQFLDLNENVKIEAMGSDVIRAIGQTFGEEVSKRLFKGELTKENGKAFDDSDLAKLGLSKFDSMDDVNNLDSIMKKLLSYEKRINSAADEETRKELIKEAIDFTKGADAGSNEALQHALDSALSSFLKAQKGQKVKLDEQAVKALATASNEAAKAMIREMKQNTKSLIDAFFKSQKKDK